MALDNRIKQIRQEKGWTQGELAEKLGIQQKQISAYENGAYKPSTEMLIKLAEVLDVSLDYLALELNGQITKLKIKDREILKFAEAIDNFNDVDKKAAKDILKLIVKQSKVKEAISM